MLSEADKARITEAIAAAEANSAGEIFCVLAVSSSGYRLVPIAWAALVALALPLPLIYVTNWPASLIYFTQLVAFIASAAFLSLPFIRYRVVPRRAMRDRAHVEALRQFLAHGLHLTDRRTGVLIFVSVAERYAEIVADAGINAKVAPAVWDEIVAAMLDPIRDGRLGDGLAAAVERCGAVLAEHFPPGAVNRDEIPNQVVEL